jgi:hypothetical protein
MQKRCRINERGVKKLHSDNYNTGNHMYENNMKHDFIENGYECVDWISPARNGPVSGFFWTQQ